MCTTSTEVRQAPRTRDLGEKCHTLQTGLVEVINIWSLYLQYQKFLKSFLIWRQKSTISFSESWVPRKPKIFVVRKKYSTWMSDESKIDLLGKSLWMFALTKCFSRTRQTTTALIPTKILCLTIGSNRFHQHVQVVINRDTAETSTSKSQSYFF